MRQTVEDKDSDPSDAIQQLEQKLNQLAITLCPPSEPIEEVLDKYTDTLCNVQKKTSLESFVARYPHIKWTGLLMVRGLAHRY